jgi:hypothetical protein
MTRIYSTPRTVDIWLGPDENDSAHVVELSHWPSADSQASLKFIRGLDRLLGRQWFERLWVIQETVLAKPGAPVLRSGSASCSWVEFANVLDNLRADESDLNKTIEALTSELELLTKPIVQQAECSSTTPRSQTRSLQEIQAAIAMSEAHVINCENNLQ